MIAKKHRPFKFFSHKRKKVLNFIAKSVIIVFTVYIIWFFSFNSDNCTYCTKSQNKKKIKL